MRQEKQKKKGEEGRKVKVETALSLLNPKFCPLMPELRKPIFLHLDQKAAKCAICKLLGGSSTGQLFQREDSDYDKALILFFLLITDGKLLQYSLLQQLITHN